MDCCLFQSSFGFFERLKCNTAEAGGDRQRERERASELMASQVGATRFGRRKREAEEGKRRAKPLNRVMCQTNNSVILEYSAYQL